MRKPTMKRNMKKWLLFMPLVFVTLTCVRLFIVANNTIFLTEPEFEAKRAVNESMRINPAAWNHQQINVSTHGLHTESPKEVTIPPFVDSRDPNGPGENGVPVNISRQSLRTEEELARFDQGLVRHVFNELASEKISVHRRVPDCTTDHCRKMMDSFNGTLPQISVVFIFYNEAWTTLLRSVHSVINRTPPHILKEIILVDDNSTFDFLKSPLDKYFSSFPLVKIIHSTGRIGLIKARLVGFEVSVAPVVVFLDSHIECFPGWAEPMLIRISRNPKAVVFPLMPNIEGDTFGLHCAKFPFHYCVFNWKYLQMEWMAIPKRVWDLRQDDADTIKSPTMPGGLFAIHREFFQKLGTYDPDLAYWGGENIELSFKTWMCGGSLEMDPCSMVGHVFRKRSPNREKYPQEMLLRNPLRVAEVWMDDYKNYYYERNNYRRVDVGNVTDRVQLRANLKCNNFEWYMKNIIPELAYPHNMIYAGVIRNRADARCLSNTFDIGIPVNRLSLQICRRNEVQQVWYMGASAQINQDDIFICVDSGTPVLRKMQCNSSEQQWQYKEEKWLYHKPSGLCLASAVDRYPTLAPCTDSGRQLWDFQRRRSDLAFPSYL